MKQGLIIGKFMPLHQGHLALIEYALDHCDALIIEVCACDDEPIPGPLRLNWLWETFRHDARVTITYNDREMPDAPYSSRTVSRIWADYLSRTYPTVRMICSSEPYGEYLAEYMYIEHCMFDEERLKVPVSATLIRERPFVYWKYIPEVVRPYFTRKVCIYGPESTGKSTLTRDLAAHYRTEYVPELARELIGNREAIYDDILPIGIAHATKILNKTRTCDKILFCDTDIITTHIYSDYFFKTIPEFAPWIYAANTFDLYLFLDIDTPWVADVQRTCGHNREYMKELFIHGLKDRNIAFTMINGSWEERFKQACTILEDKWYGLKSS